MRYPWTLPLAPLAAFAALLATGCLHTSQEIKPIHITLDVNLKVDKELDDFFGDIDEAETPAPTQKHDKHVEATPAAEAVVEKPIAEVVESTKTPAAEDASAKIVEPPTPPVTEAPAIQASSDTTTVKPLDKTEEETVEAQTGKPNDEAKESN